MKSKIPEKLFKPVYEMWLEGYGELYVAKKFDITKGLVRRIVFEECKATDSDKTVHAQRQADLRRSGKMCGYGRNKGTPKIGLRGSQFHRANARREFKPFVKPLTEEERSWIISPKYCEGCIYYGYLNGHAGLRCCDYTFVTGDASKMEKPCECTRRKGKKRGKT